MRCPQCGHDNKEGRQNCSLCGALLTPAGPVGGGTGPIGGMGQGNVQDNRKRNRKAGKLTVLLIILLFVVLIALIVSTGKKLTGSDQNENGSVNTDLSEAAEKPVQPVQEEEAGEPVQEEPEEVQPQYDTSIEEAFGITPAKYTYSFENSLDGAVIVTRANDNEEGRNDGTLPEEAPDRSGMYSGGVKGNAIILDGSYGVQLKNIDPPGASFTVSFWVKADELVDYSPMIALGTDFMNTDNRQAYMAIYKLDDGEEGQAVSPEVRTHNEPRDIWFYLKNQLTFDSGSRCMDLGTWYHIVLVVDGEKQGEHPLSRLGMLYVNGALADNGDVAIETMEFPGATVYLGMDARNINFRGMIDEVKIWDSPLTQTEVAMLYGGYTMAE